MDPKTGTLRLRAALPNADGLLMPGLSVRVRLTTGKPYKALMVPVRAWREEGRQLGTGKAFVLVVNEKDEVEEREVGWGRGTATWWRSRRG